MDTVYLHYLTGSPEDILRWGNERYVMEAFQITDWLDDQEISYRLQQVTTETRLVLSAKSAALLQLFFEKAFKQRRFNDNELADRGLA